MYASTGKILHGGGPIKEVYISYLQVIKVWDMRDLCCVQTIPSRSFLPGPHPISSIYYSSKLHCILVGTNQVSHITQGYIGTNKPTLQLGLLTSSWELRELRQNSLTSERKRSA
jgi:hypothetical protein